LLIDKTSSVYLYVKLKALASWIFLSFTLCHYIILTDYPGIQFHRYISLNYINFNQYLRATCFLVIYSSYQCPVNFGKDSWLIIRCVNGDFTNKHSNSFH
jgi:hypothetical protein